LYIINLHSPKGVLAIIIIIVIATTYCKIWIHAKITQFKNLVCFSCNSPNDDLENVETYSVHLRIINNAIMIQQYILYLSLEDTILLC
jgi:hypothetical protein